jgi:nucleoside-diphosphate-sugar epimerase
VVFGEGNRGNVYTLAKQVSSGRFIMVGDGSNKKSMSYVGNIVEFLADALGAPAGQLTSNFADKPDLSTAELITVLKGAMNISKPGRLRLPLGVGLAAGHLFDLAAKLSGRTFPVSAIRIRKFAADTTVNTDRLLASGYRPRFTLSEALERTIAAEFPGGKDQQ